MKSYLLARTHWTHFEFVLARRAFESLLTVDDARQLMPRLVQAQPADPRLQQRLAEIQAQALLQAYALAIQADDFGLAHQVIDTLGVLNETLMYEAGKLWVKVRSAELKVREHRSSAEVKDGLKTFKELLALASFVLTDQIVDKILQVRDEALLAANPSVSLDLVEADF